MSHSFAVHENHELFKSTAAAGAQAGPVGLSVGAGFTTTAYSVQHSDHIGEGIIKVTAVS